MNSFLKLKLNFNKIFPKQLAKHYTQNRQRFSNKLNQKKISSTSSTARNQNEAFRPYVSKPYSYAFGRSDQQLIYRTMGQMLDEHVGQESGRPLVVSDHEGLLKTVTEFSEDVGQIAKAMYRELGLKKGDVVGLWSSNIYNWLTIQYACARIGVILCTINPYYQPAELDYALRKGDVKALFMPGKNSPQGIVNNYAKILRKALSIENIGSDQLILEHIISIDGETYGSGDIPVNLSSIKIHCLEILKKGQNPVLDSSVTNLVSPDDPAIIMFTSGTTGKPKGALLSQFNITNNAKLMTNSLGSVKENVSVCMPLPLFHSIAAVLGAVAMVVLPFQLVLPCLKHDINKVVKSIQENQCTHLFATPTLLIDLLDHIRKHKAQLPSLRGLGVGGASVPLEIGQQLLEALPNCTDFMIGYGSTELSPLSTINRQDHTFKQRTETVGTPMDFVEVKIVNTETRRVVKLGETGEILSKGYNTMLGYWKDEEKTKEAIDPTGWYSTGDLGAMDEDGFLKIIGRTKEMIIVGGENVYPREIEEHLHTHPSILDVHVIGVPHARKGEEVCAWVKLANPDDDKITEEELKKFCRNNLAYFKVPKHFMFVDSFPTTSVGKAKKFVMRQITCEKLGLKEN